MIDSSHFDSGLRRAGATRFADTPDEAASGLRLRSVESIDLKAIVDASPDLITIVSPEGDFLYASGAVNSFGWRPEDLVGAKQDAFLHDDDAPSLLTARATASKSAGTVTTMGRLRRRDGSFRWCEIMFRRMEDSATGNVVASVRDTNDRTTAEIDLQRQADTDPLTGVANRTVFKDRLHQGLLRLERNGGLLAVLFLDLDRFKVINDSLGHLVGDEVLTTVAIRLKGFLRPTDTLARLGGDEFAIIAEGVKDQDDAVELGERITGAGHHPFRVGNDEDLVCTLSVGIATTSDPHYSGEALLQEADLALYRAKDRGRNRSEVFDEDLRTTAIGRIGTERMLRRAIGEKRLRIQYQPIVDLKDGHVESVEALIRVFDVVNGLVFPDSFLDVAEETGLLVRIDEFVLEEAIQQAALWRSEFAGSGFAGVAINMTARHLADSQFSQRICETLEENDLPGACLKVEVTERVLMETSHSAMSALRMLRDSGVEVGLDDFGTGYSSLAYLRQFPLDFVKVDQSFVRHLNDSDADVAIVAAIIGLSHALGLRVVAEGIERTEQLETLQSLACDLGQGFLFAKSAPAGAIGQLVRARASGSNTERIA